MASTYPGIIPYRSSSPSSPNNGGRDSQLPQLIKVNQNFSLGRRPVSIAETNANAVRLERQRSQLENDQNVEDEILRERYFQYWAQQQVRNQITHIDWVLVFK